MKIIFTKKAVMLVLLLLPALLWGHILGELLQVQYGIAQTPWDEQLGSQRAVVQIPAAGHYKTVIPWRLRNYPNSNIILQNLDTNEFCSSVIRGAYDNSFGEVAFYADKKGTYGIYYLPYKPAKTHGSFNSNYSIYLPSSYRSPSSAQNISVTKIESRTNFDSFYPMEVCATQKEKSTLIESAIKSDNLNSKFLIFTEDRVNPVKMKKIVPLKWCLEGTKNSISLRAKQNEYYAFQIAILPLVDNLNNLRINYHNIPKEIKATCFNIEGVNYKGDYFTKTLNLKKDEIQALWFGLDIPRNMKASTYKFEVELSLDNSSPRSIGVELNIENEILADRGDSNPYLHSRLRWLNSTLGSEEVLITPFSPVVAQTQGDSAFISLLNKKIELSPLGLFKSITVSDSFSQRELLANEITLSTTTKVAQRLIKTHTDIQNKNVTSASWKTVSEFDAYTMDVDGKIEFDSHSHFDVRFTFLKDCRFDDIALHIPFNKLNATSMMGMGRGAQDIPLYLKSHWKKGQDSFWVGSPLAGLHVELLGSIYSGPLINHYAPPFPKVWYNNNRGSFQIRKDEKAINALVTTGKQSYKAGEQVSFSFNMIITPSKPIDTKSHFSYRYFHNPLIENAPFDKGVNVINIHHANPYNPYINYPFLTPNNSKKIVDAVHAKGAKVKFYYTVREVSAVLPELYALMSLGDEIIAPGNGGGFVWLREHLDKNYCVAWYAHNGGFFDGVNSIGNAEESEGLIPDAAIVMNINSRWYNYYIEGLKWMLINYDLDGLYLDDVAFDRTIVKRMRVVMDSIKPGCLIDLHSNTGFSAGPALQYADFFPYIDRVWFGESFYYNLMSPTAYLVESSGIPFGLMGEMLYRGGNLWKGMVYGMTNRYGWVTEGVLCDPSGVWELFDSVSISKKRMIGYWDSRMPISCSNKNVIATIYESNDKKEILLVAANFSKSKTFVTFDSIVDDFDLATYSVSMPQIKGMQTATRYNQPLNKIRFALRGDSGVAIVLTKQSN